jgi:putative membrane protein
VIGGFRHCPASATFVDDASHVVLSSDSEQEETFMNGIPGARTAIAVGALFALATGSALFARGTGKTSSQQTSDRAFAKKADQGDLAEVKLAQLAESKTQNPTVQAFAQRMIRDHSKANDQLQEVASSTNVNLPGQPNANQQQTYDQLSKLNGRAFDRAYAQDMVKDHEHDVAAFKNEADNGSNPQIQQFAQNTLPILRKHLTLARQMYRDVENQGGHGAGRTNGGGATTPR